MNKRIDILRESYDKSILDQSKLHGSVTWPTNCNPTSACMSHLLIYILVLVVLQYATNDVQNLMVLIGSGSTYH